MWKTSDYILWCIQVGWRVICFNPLQQLRAPEKADSWEVAERTELQTVGREIFENTNLLQSWLFIFIETQTFISLHWFQVQDQNLYPGSNKALSGLIPPSFPASVSITLSFSSVPGTVNFFHLLKWAMSPPATGSSCCLVAAEGQSSLAPTELPFIYQISCIAFSWKPFGLLG